MTPTSSRRALPSQSPQRTLRLYCRHQHESTSNLWQGKGTPKTVLQGVSSLPRRSLLQSASPPPAPASTPASSPPASTSTGVANQAGPSSNPTPGTSSLSNTEVGAMIERLLLPTLSPSQSSSTTSDPAHEVGLRELGRGLHRRQHCWRVVLSVQEVSKVFPAPDRGYSACINLQLVPLPGLHKGKVVAAQEERAQGLVAPE